MLVKIKFMLNIFLILIFISTMVKVYSKDSIKLPFNIDACICNKLGMQEGM